MEEETSTFMEELAIDLDEISDELYEELTMSGGTFTDARDLLPARGEIEESNQAAVNELGEALERTEEALEYVIDLRRVKQRAEGLLEEYEGYRQQEMY